MFRAMRPVAPCGRAPRSQAIRFVVLLGLLLVSLPNDDVRAQGGQSSEDVAEEIARVQLRADSTAEAWREADFEAEDVATELFVAEQDVAAAATLDSMEQTLSNVAVRRFIQNGSAGPVIFFTDDPMTRSRSTRCLWSRRRRAH